MIEELRKLLKHTTIFGLGGILGKLVGFLLIPFYTHYLLPYDYGTLELLDLTVSVIGLILNVWITGPVLRYYFHYEDPRDQRRVISTALIGSIVPSVCIAATLYFCAPAVASLVLRSPAQFYYVRLISLTLLFTSVASVGGTYLRARQQSTMIVVLNLIGLLVSVSLNIYLIAFLHFGAGGMLFASLMMACSVNAYYAVHAFAEVGFEFDWAKLRALVAFGAPLFFSSVAAFVLNFSDRFFLQHYSTLAAVGIYALGYKFGYMLSFLIVQPFIMIWGARAYEVAKKERGSEYIGRIVEYFSLVLVAGALGISLVIREVITIVASAQFYAAYRVVPLIALAYVFQGLALYFQSGLLIEKRSGVVGAIGVGSMAVNIAANFALIPRYHAMGAAVATAVTFAVQAGLTFVQSRKMYRAPYRIRRICVPVLVAVTIYLLSTQTMIGNIAASLACKLVLFSLFPMTLLVIRFFDTAELDALRGLLNIILRGNRSRAAAAPN